MESCDPIISAVKSFNGISIVWLSGDESMSELFSYENLIDMKINVADLLNYPERYGIVKGPKVIRTEFCSPKYSPDD